MLSRHLDAGYVAGAVAVVARHGEVHIEATDNLAFEGEGSSMPVAADTICRIASMTKPVVAACAMTPVEDSTLRLDDPVDEFLPGLADMTVLADPDGPLDQTVPAERQITLRDQFTFTLGTGIVVAEPGTIPMADALGAFLGRINSASKSLSPTAERSRERRPRAPDDPPVVTPLAGSALSTLARYRAPPSTSPDRISITWSSPAQRNQHATPGRLTSSPEKCLRPEHRRSRHRMTSNRGNRRETAPSQPGRGLP